MKPILQKPLLLLTLLLVPTLTMAYFAAAQQQVDVKPTYTYPDQPSSSEMAQQDKDKQILTDGVKAAMGGAAVYGKWAEPAFTVDWDFPTPVKITSVELAIVHADPDTDNSHPGKVSFYGADEKSEFLGEPDATIDIPFQKGNLQNITLAIPGDGLVVKRLRTDFKAVRYQVILSEVRFETQPATAGQVSDATKARLAKQPPPVKEINFLPAPVGATATLQAGGSPLFGMCGHMLHTPPFYQDSSPYWNLDYTLPFVAGKFAWVREPLYEGLFFKGTPADWHGAEQTKLRAEVDRQFARYDQAGVKILLTPMFSKWDEPQVTPFCEWMVELAKKHPCIKMIELHNEPNLGGFWQHSVEDYVETSRRVTAILKKGLPQTPIIIGSFSGWGHAQNLSDVKAHGAGSKIEAFNFSEAVFRLGGLDFADGVSAHPYRNASAPEGGSEVESPTDPEGFEKEIREYWKLVESYNAKKKPLKLLFTELGYSSATSGYSVTGNVERQADYLSRLMLILQDVHLRGTPLETVFWYDLKGDDPKVGEYEANFGLVSNNTSQVRPGYTAYQRISAMFAKPETLKPVNTPVSWVNTPNVTKYYQWQRSDGALIVAFWRMNQLQPVDRDFDSELQLQIPATWKKASVQLYDLHEATPRFIGSRLEGNKLNVPLRVTARAAWIVIKGSNG